MVFHDAEELQMANSNISGLSFKECTKRGVGPELT